MPMSSLATLCLVAHLLALANWHATAAHHALFLTETENHPHSVITTAYKASAAALENIGWTADRAFESTGFFTAEALAKYNVVVFFFTNGDSEPGILDASEKVAFQNWYRSGKGFVGVHSAVDTYATKWPWYNKLIGAGFNGHLSPRPGAVSIKDRSFEAVAHLPDYWNITDEWYNFNFAYDPPRSKLNVIATVDTRRYYEGRTTSSDHPIIWAHEYDGGRSFYTGLGHIDTLWSYPDFVKHIAEGIRWAARESLGNAGPNKNYQETIQINAPGPATNPIKLPTGLPMTTPTKATTKASTTRALDEVLVVHAINVGSEVDFVNGDGITYKGDYGYSTSGTFDVEEIIDANANEGVLYQIERHAKDGPFSYSLGVDPGKRYCITFKLAEIFWKADPDEWAERGWVYNGWKRVFDIWVEGEVAFSNVNTFEQAGALYKAHDLKYEYAATDSNLNIEFKNVIKKAKVNAILVEEFTLGSPEPTHNPTKFPTGLLTTPPSRNPTRTPMANPTTTSSPTKFPTGSPTKGPTDVAATYVPGDLTVPCEGLTLSTGLACRMLTMRGSKIQFEDGTESSVNMHQRPDGAAVIPHPTDGGWYYLSNSEMNNDQGLVGSLRFNSDGHLIDYQTHLTTSRNCGGGRTPWNTWVSCEENSNNGVCWEVDPYTEFEQETLVTDIGGNYESFAYDNQDPSAPNSTRYFVTEDSSNGALIRYTPHPNAYNTDSNYDILSSPDGTHEFLILNPDDLTFHWTTDRTQGENNATDIFPYTEGIDCHNRILNFVSKTRKTLFTLDLEMGTYIASSTVSGLFDLQPDQLKRAVGDGKILYFAEDGGNDCDIHGRDSTGQYFTIVRGDDYPTETTGLAFSPNGIYFYAAYQTDANIFVFWRTDGLPFNGIVADTKYHTSR